MGRTSQELKEHNHILQVAYDKSLKDNQQLQEDHIRLTKANQFKLIILIASVGLSSLSLSLSIWGTVDNTVVGLSKTGIALSSLSLGLSLLGVFKNNLCKNQSPPEGELELDENKVGRELNTLSV